jgi:excinuclease ABC subunit C
MQTGLDKLKDIVKYLPKSAGVYKMFDKSGNILYIGKARNLKNRVTNYTQINGLSNRIKRMVFLIDSVEIVETLSDTEALILESNLIKQHKPRFNVKLKDDSSYPYIFVPYDQNYIPKIFRGNLKDEQKNGKLFGPFPNSKAAQKTLELLIKIFKIRTCSDSEFKNRKKPCLRYDLRLCSAPCVNLIKTVDYNLSLQQAIEFMQGGGLNLIKNLELKMSDFALNEQYEQAAIYRDRIKDLSSIMQNSSAANTQDLIDCDIWGLHYEGGKACLQLFMYRNGLHMGNQKIFPKDTEENSISEIMHYTLLLHYDNKIPPKNILCSEMPDEYELLQEIFASYKGQNVYINKPSRGDKLKLVEQAKNNAENELKRKASKSSSIKKQLEILGEVLDYQYPIERIEMYDISNTQGTNPVASMVVATPDGMQVSQYRKFAIKTKDTPDDYAMMREALMRRYSRLQKENTPMPSIVMVDGGKGHLKVLTDVFDELNLSKTATRLCAIAKGEYRDKGLEKIYLSGNDEPLPIEYNSPLIFLLQNIRDESHRTAIGYHRKLRSKAMVKSALDDIEGIGPAKKKALLAHFGGVSVIKNASIDEIANVPGFSKKLAEIVYQALR